MSAVRPRALGQGLLAHSSTFADFTTPIHRQVDQNREKCLRREINYSRSSRVYTDNVEIVRPSVGMDG